MKILKQIYHRILCLFNKHELILEVKSREKMFHKCKWCNYQKELSEFEYKLWTSTFDIVSELIDMVLPENIHKPLDESDNIRIRSDLIDFTNCGYISFDDGKTTIHTIK